MSRLTLSPRAALVLAGAVVVVAIVVILLGARGDDTGGVTTVTGAPSLGVSERASAGAASSSPFPAGDASTSSSSVVVHVLGAVGHAGVVTLPVASRVTDALDAAGGAADDADLARLNLARPVQDGERLYVPRVGEVDVPQELDGASGATPGSGGAGAGGAGAGGAGAGGTGDVVDLNTADQAALETLPGIGPALAGRILAWRDEHGRFSSVDDLLDVSGIGDARLADLRPRVRV
jgi:competence protein ComEA